MRILICVKNSLGNDAELQLPCLRYVKTWRTGLALCCLGILGAQIGMTQAPVQPPEPVDPSPINGETYYFINQLSGLQMDLNNNSTAPGSAILQNTRSLSDLSQRWAMSKMPDGNWKIGNILSGLCLDSTGGAHATTVQNLCGINVATQEWSFTYASNYAAFATTANGYNTITNVGTGQVLTVADSSTSAGAGVVQTALSANTPTGSQLWLFRPAYWRGNDSSTEEVEEYDRSTQAENTADLPWWHDAYLPGQDILQIFKNAGLNAIRIRPASINATYQYGNLTYSMSTGPYTKYTVGAGSATTFPINQTTQVYALTNPGYGAVETDWSGVDLAVRAKKLGMSVFLNLFYDGNGGSNPGNWVNEPITALEGSPENPNGGNGQYLVYNYVKQLLEFYRAAGGMPDLVALGNEANLGLFTNLDGSNYTPSGPTMSAAATAFQLAGLQAVADAATDTSNPALLGPPVAVPLRCVDIDGTPNLDTFFKGPKSANLPIDVGCQSYYPGWGGPMTQAQYNYTPHGNTNGTFSTPQNIEETTMNAEIADPAAGFPIFTSEDGVAYTNVGGDTPLDDYYGSQLKVTPNPASRTLEREYYIDLESVQHNATNHMGMGMDCWACETTPMSGDAYSGTGNGNPGQYWLSAQLGFFDNASSTTVGTLPAAAAGTKPLDNATLPALMGMGGKTDPTLTYKLVNANGGILETALASTAAGALLDVAVDNGISSQHQEWQILAQGADVEVYTGPKYNGTIGSNGTNLMNNLGDGYFQIVNQNQSGGVYVLDNLGSVTPGSAVVQNTQGSVPTTVPANTSFANQEWDIMTVGNCGDIPANCTTPPLTVLGDYYVIVNKDSGMLLSLNGSAIEQTEPASASNGDWIVPASKGQLWQIVPVHISAASTPAVLVFASAPPSSFAVGGNLGTINVNVENTSQALIESPVESVTLTITGPQEFSQTVSSSAAVASFNLSSLALATPGVYTLTASGSGLASAASSFSVVAAPTVILTTTATLSGSAANGYTAAVTVTNTGTGSASNVQLNTASLGTGAGSTLPQSLGTLAANGGSVTVTVNFPGTAGSDGARVAESYSGTSSGGSFSASIRAVLP